MVAGRSRDEERPMRRHRSSRTPQRAERQLFEHIAVGWRRVVVVSAGDPSMASSRAVHRTLPREIDRRPLTGEGWRADVGSHSTVAS